MMKESAHYKKICTKYAGYAMTQKHDEKKRRLLSIGR